jgi:TRAP-type uncharacterized transport system fused permease subunit
VPFMAVYAPSLMLQEGGSIAAAFGYPVEVVYVVLKASLAIALWGAAFVGFLVGRMLLWERALAFVAGASLVLALPWTDEAGFVLALVAVGLHVWRVRGAGKAAVGV